MIIQQKIGSIVVFKKKIASMHKIYNANGTGVAGIGNRSGKIFSRRGNWGGKIIKNKSVTLKDYKWIHDDALPSRKKLLEEAVLAIEDETNMNYNYESDFIPVIDESEDEYEEDFDDLRILV